MPRAVVLLSGGLDSTTCLAIAAHSGIECHCLGVDYGQRNQFEQQCARHQAEAFADGRLLSVKVDLRAIGGSALTSEADVPKDGLSDGIPVTYVPARNAILLALATGLAEVVGAESVYIGVNVIDYSGYPDCRPDFLSAFEEVVRLGTKAGSEGKGVKIRAPLLHMTKPEIVAKGVELGVDYRWTSSCYDPGPGGASCGLCDSCRIRSEAFEKLGLADPSLRHN